MIDRTIGKEVFLQGEYLNVGLNAYGTIGTMGAAPKGFTTDAVNGYVRLGMLADMDGFGKGAVATRDAMLAGTPVEGFSLGYDIGGKRYVKANDEMEGKTDIAGSSTNLTQGTVGSAGWAGTTDQNVKISQVVTLSDDAKFMKFEVTLSNQSAAAVSNLRYMRTIDPDHGTGFKTTNTIVEQGGDGADGALIAAYGSGNKLPLFYFTQDDRAIVSTYGLENYDPYAKAAVSGQTEGTSINADQAINLNFGLGTLAAGTATTIVFYLGVTDDLTGTIAAIKAEAAGGPAKPAVNIAPDAVGDALSLTTGTTGTGKLLANDKDADGDALTAALVTGPKHGAVTLKADGSYSYIADKGYVGADSFVYAASDGKAATNATVAITVAARPNAGPTVAADTITVMAGRSVTGNLLANDSDADGDALIATIASGPSHGTVKIAADGSFVYVADKGYTGADSFHYTASDGKASARGQVSVTIDPLPNAAPTVSDVAMATVGTAAVTGNVLAKASDADGDALAASLMTGPTGGTLSLAADGTFSYVANAGYAGTDSFTFGVSDGTATSVAKVTLAVAALPLPPVPVVTDPLTALARGTLLDGSAAGNQTLTGTAAKDVFYFDTDKVTGTDTIVNFGREDILATSQKIFDGNGDGLITFKKKLSLDSGGADSVAMTGATSLRLMGVDADGSYIYANGAGRPKNAVESDMGDNALRGDVGDKRGQVFFFDTNLDLALGHDTIANFGSKDVIVTTSNLGLDMGASLDLTGIEGNDLGSVDITGMTGAPISGLELDRSFDKGGVTYYVYSLADDLAGTASVTA